MSEEALARVLAVSLVGLDGHPVEVETHVGRGLVSFTLVGLPDASLREAKDRVRSALQACGVEVLDRHVTVNLSPAGLAKSGSGFDAAIALSVLVASGTVIAASLTSTVVIAELALDGTLRPVPGILPALLAASRHGLRRALVPEACREEALLVPGLEVLTFEHLADVIRWAGGEATRPLTLGAGAETGTGSPVPAGRTVGTPDLADVRGQRVAREALEVAAAGGHHLVMVGEPGAGKTMLASRLVTILPPLDDDTAVTVTALRSVAGLLDASGGLVRTPPLEAPHHTATMPALIGGGAGMPRPGAVSLAHGGVLLLDEAAEFAPSVLDALRQPLEEGRVTIHRARATAHYPASFQLVLATNPCPCGYADSRSRTCTCSSVQRQRYLSRLSGPLLDRIDIRVDMRTPTRADLAADAGESSATVRERVRSARERAMRRWRGSGWVSNAQLPGPFLREHSGIEAHLLTLLDRGVERGTLSLRGADRVLRLMWTLADLAGRPTPDETDLARALALRTGGSHG